MITSQKAEKPVPVIPTLKTAESTKGLDCSKHLKDEYPNQDALLQALNANAEKLLEESAAVYLDGRMLFPLNADGTIIETGRIWHERENRWILASVGNSAYVTDPETKKVKR